MHSESRRGVSELGGVTEKKVPGSPEDQHPGHQASPLLEEYGNSQPLSYFSPSHLGLARTHTSA